MRVVVVVVLVAGVVLAVGEGRASACSCDALPVEEMLMEADGAFIGSLAEVGTGSGFDDVPYTFDVAEWVKGDRAAGPFVVHSAADGSSCGFETPIGAEVAVFVWVRGDRATGGLCSTYDAATLRAVLQPPGLADGPGAFLATSWTGPSYVLNAEGGVVAVHPDRTQSAQATQHTPCGGSVIAERRGEGVALVDLATFEDLEVLQFKRSTQQLLCDGARVYGVAGPAGERQVYDIRTREPISGVVAARSGVVLVGDQLRYRAKADDRYPAGWRSWNVATGEERFIAEISLGSRRMESVDYSADGGRVAFTLAEGNQAVLDVVVLDLDSGDIVTRTVATHVASVRWLDDTQLFIAAEGGGFPDTENSLIVDGDDLTTIIDFGTELFWPTHLQDGDLIGFDGGTLRAMSLGDDFATRPLNDLPGGHALLRLPEPVQMETIGSAADGPLATPIASPVMEALPDLGPTPEGEPAPATTEVPASSPPLATDGSAEQAAAAVSNDGGGSNDDGATPLWFVIGLAAILVAAGMVVFALRRTNTRGEPRHGAG